MQRREVRAHDAVRALMVVVLLAYIAFAQGWFAAHAPSLTTEQRFLRFVDQVVWQRSE